MNLLKNAVMRIAAATFAAGVTVGAAYADIRNVVNVTLPETVSVGDRTLPGGQYSISEVPVAGEESLFIFRNSNGAAVAVVPAERVAGAPQVPEAQKTEIVLSPDEAGTVHLNQMFIAGEPAGYQFQSVR